MLLMGGSVVSAALLSAVACDADSPSGTLTPALAAGDACIPDDARFLQRLYEDVAPASSAWCIDNGKGGVQVVVRTNNTDLRLKAPRSFIRTVHWDKASNSWTGGSAFPVELRDASQLTPSPSGKAMALVRSALNGTTRQYFIEVGRVAPHTDRVVILLQTVG